MIGAGIHPDISHADYHGDPCIHLSVSHSLTRFIIKRTAYHAMMHHPKLGKMPFTSSRSKRRGNAAHTLILGKGAELEVIDADDFKKKIAQEMRDAALAAGRVPVLKGEFAAAQAKVKPGREALEEALGAKLDDCLVEAVVIAQDPATGCWRRIMVDAMTRDFKRMADYKTAEDAGPEAFERSVRNFGYDTQDVFYRRVMDLAAGEADREYTIVAQESNYPDCVTFHQIDGDLRAVAEHTLGKALAKWDAGVTTGTWEGYSRSINFVQARAYEINEAMVEGAENV